MPGRGNNTRTILILSSGRTGTLFLARYFDANYEGVTARHEPPLSRLIRMASHARMEGVLSDRSLRTLLAWKGRREDPGGGDLYIEANPYLSGCADLLGDIWENPTIVHVVRDPREHARSALKHGMSRGLKGRLNRYLPFWYPNVRRLLDLDHRPNWLEMAACVWRLFNSLLQEAAPRYDDYHLLRYEEIFDDSFSGLRRLCGILGLDYRDEGSAVSPSERINRGRLKILPPWPEWTAEQCRQLHSICSPLMEEFGYGTEPKWLARISPDE